MTHKKPEWFTWGVSTKKNCGKYGSESCETYYGVSNTGQWRLNGIYITSGLHGHVNDKIRKRIDMKHFMWNGIQVDLYLDCDEGIFRLCVVGMEVNINNEVEIIGLNKCGNENGWVPNLIFCFNGGTTVRCGKIDASYYGEALDIRWH